MSFLASLRYQAASDVGRRADDALMTCAHLWLEREPFCTFWWLKPDVLRQEKVNNAFSSRIIAKELR